jgi:NAD(P)-dependent dehydrogenase (short-subunit alcohol dehydrogenase family)
MMTYFTVVSFRHGTVPSLQRTGKPEFDTKRGIGVRRAAAAGGRAIVIMSSVVAETGHPTTALYSATMSAYDGMVYALATELGPQGIRVNLVRPGVVATERVASPPMTRR